MILDAMKNNQEAAHTNPDQLFPIGIINVCIQDFLPVHQGHPSKTSGNII
jgi:hypothetical protein